MAAGTIPETGTPHATACHILVTLRGFEALAAAGVERAVLADAAASITLTLLGGSPE